MRLLASNLDVLNPLTRMLVISFYVER